VIDVALLPSGTVDTTLTSQSDLTYANSLLMPLTSFAQSQSQTSSTIDIWKLLNSLFVGYYWFILGDLGQSSPVTYNILNDFLLPSNFSQPLIRHPPTNNLFFNTTLAETVFSNIGLNDTALVDAITIPNWAANEPSPKFRWTYLCNQRQLKPVLDLIVSVFGLALSLLHGMYFVGIVLLGWILRRCGHEPGQTAARLEQNGSNRSGYPMFHRVGRWFREVFRRRGNRNQEQWEMVPGEGSNEEEQEGKELGMREEENKDEWTGEDDELNEWRYFGG